MNREGIYQAKIFGPPGKRIQVILLDTRTFRGTLKVSATPLPLGLYVPNENKSVTLLGEAQWKWLEEEFKKPAELRFVLTGYQFLALDSHFECWNNLPHERERMLELIKKTNAGGVVFFSGDRHLGMILHEFSKEEPYELWEVTSSGLTHALPDTAPVEADRNMVGKIFFGLNFGWVDIDWKNKRLSLQIRDEKGKVGREKTVTFKSLHVVP
jgi:alkaline phosphatase D